MGVGADAGAPKGVLGDAGTAGDSERGGMADGRARVPEVLVFQLPIIFSLHFFSISVGVKQRLRNGSDSGP